MQQDMDYATESWVSPFKPKESKPTPPMYIVRWASQVHNGGFVRKDGTITKPRNQGKAHGTCKQCGHRFILSYMRECRKIDDWFGSGVFWVCSECRHTHRDTYTCVEEE